MLRKVIVRELSEIGGAKTAVKIFEPEREENGDYTTNVAFSLAKVSKKSPAEVAGEISKKIQTSKIIG